jgi:hypothetical protein
MGLTKPMESNYTRYCNDSFSFCCDRTFGMDRFLDISVEFHRRLST